MNRPSKTKSLLIPLFTALTGIFAACTNSDYDFNEIDLTLGLGGDELNLPTSGTRDMHINDFLELEEGDCVQILDNGDYAFLQYGSDVEPASPYIERPTFTFSALDKDYFLDDKLNEGSTNIKAMDIGKTTAKDGNTIEMEKQEIATFEYKAHQEDIVSLVNAGVESMLELHTSYSDNLKRCIGAFISMEWTLPEFMEVDVSKTKTDKGKVPSFDKTTNKLRLENVSTNEDLTLYVYMSGLNFENTEEGRISSDNGYLTIAGKIYLEASAGYEITEENTNYTHECYIKTKLESKDGIEIAYATGQFDPDIDLGDIGDVTVSNVPDFLKEDGVYIDLYNPMVLLEIDNNMDVAAEQVSAVLTATKDSKSVYIDVPGVRIRSYNADYIERAKQHNQTVTNEKDKLPENLRTTKILACESRDRFDKETLRAYEEDSLYEILEVPELKKILIDGKIPDRLKFELDVTVDKNRTSSIELGNNTYIVKPRYKILIPIAFGEKAVIAYTDSIDNLQNDLDGIDFAKDAYLELTADVYSRLPMHLDTEVLPLTIDGKNLKNSKEVTVEVDEDIPGTDDENTPAKGRLRIKIGGDIKQLDKLKFTLKGSASESSKSIVGITLNEYKHSLQLKNVNMKLKGRLIYDAN